MEDRKKNEWELEKESTQVKNNKVTSNSTRPAANLELEQNNRPVRKGHLQLIREMEQEELQNSLVAAPLARRLGAFALDTLWRDVSLWIGAAWSVPILEDQYIKLLAWQKINQTLPPNELALLLQTVAYLALFILLYGLPTIWMKNTWGKKLFGLWIGTPSGEVPWQWQIAWRELVARPLCTITLIGPLMIFFSSKRRSLHDWLSGTIVYKD